jgi:hypothetical protein
MEKPPEGGFSALSKSQLNDTTKGLCLEFNTPVASLQHCMNEANPGRCCKYSLHSSSTICCSFPRCSSVKGTSSFKVIKPVLDVIIVPMTEPARLISVGG